MSSILCFDRDVDDVVPPSPTQPTYPFSFSRLPPELLLHIASYLTPVDLADFAQVSKACYEVANDDRIWHSLLQRNLPGCDLDLSPASGDYRQIYLAHNPYWFITRNRVWISDSPLTGKLVVARYSPSRKVIEAYALGAARGNIDLHFWQHNPDVIIHSFDPCVQANLDQSVLRIPAASPNNFPSDDSRFQREISMDMPTDPRGRAAMFSQLMLARPLPERAITSQTAIWPPSRLPCPERSRNESQESFVGSGHRPSRLSEISESAFRIRRWVEFSSHFPASVEPNVRVGEDVRTYATLSPHCFTPTARKPWRGIWVGDYSGHGCEFLVVLQPDEPATLPKMVKEIFAKRESKRRASGDSDSSWRTALSDAVDEDEIVGEWMMEAASEEWMGSISNQDHASTNGAVKNAPSRSFNNAESDEDSTEVDYSGQLLAIKLTGDPNVPRGEYSWIVPDISDEGTIRIAQEAPFKGARVLRSCGHVASTGFLDDTYIPSQLILVDEDTLAQYWEAFGHISYYRRVDIDKFTRCD